MHSQSSNEQHKHDDNHHGHGHQHHSSAPVSGLQRNETIDRSHEEATKQPRRSELACFAPKSRAESVTTVLGCVDWGAAAAAAAAAAAGAAALNGHTQGLMAMMMVMVMVMIDDTRRGHIVTSEAWISRQREAVASVVSRVHLSEPGKVAMQGIVCPYA